MAYCSVRPCHSDLPGQLRLLSFSALSAIPFSSPLFEFCSEPTSPAHSNARFHTTPHPSDSHVTLSLLVPVRHSPDLLSSISHRAAAFVSNCYPSARSGSAPLSPQTPAIPFRAFSWLYLSSRSLFAPYSGALPPIHLRGLDSLSFLPPARVLLAPRSLPFPAALLGFTWLTRSPSSAFFFSGPASASDSPRHTFLPPAHASPPHLFLPRSPLPLTSVLASLSQSGTRSERSKINLLNAAGMICSHPVAIS